GLVDASLLFLVFQRSRTPETYTLSLHDALPISGAGSLVWKPALLGRIKLHFVKSGSSGVDLWQERSLLLPAEAAEEDGWEDAEGDRKSTRLNSSHVKISYAVFCLKKKKKILLTM